MARPRKNTVDYFPHDCTGGKTMFILQSRFGNDGYACWFHILEELGKANNHVIDVRNPVTYEYLTAITHVEPGILRQILDLLAKLDAIDKDLWEIGAIYSQNFVDNVSDAYRNRKDSMPTKESVIEFLTLKTEFLTSETGFLPISYVGKPQTKVKETKRDETKEENTPGNEILNTGVAGKRSKKSNGKITPEIQEKFDNFWSIYPHRKGDPKKPALLKFAAALKKGIDSGVIAEGVEAFRASVAGEDPQFIPQAVTWLNQERWADDYSQPAATEPDIDEYGWTRKERGLE